MSRSHKPFLLTYHDVRWNNCAQVHVELQSLLSQGFPRWSLLVIPDTPSEQILAFRQQLLQWQAQGHELILHGHQHQASKQWKRSWTGRLQLRLTGGEAEFAGLSYADCKVALEEAIRAWEHLELGRAVGLVPPTWHASEYLCDLALKVGWSFYEMRGSIITQTDGQRKVFSSIPLSLAGLPSWAQQLALFGEQIPWRGSQIPRLALHPGELSGPLGPGIKKTLAKWGSSGHAILYEELSKVSTFRA